MKDDTALCRKDFTEIGTDRLRGKASLVLELHIAFEVRWLFVMEA